MTVLVLNRRRIVVAGDGLEDLDDRMAELEAWWQAACRRDPPPGAS